MSLFKEMSRLAQLMISWQVWKIETPRLDTKVRHPGLNRRLKAWVRHQVPELVPRQVKERQGNIRVVVAGHKPMPELEKVRRQLWRKR
jgi:hypothetical protein